MRTDSLARRLRHAPPNPVVRRLVLTEADHLLFEAINRHGPLPTHYLFRFVSHIRKDYTHFQNRLTEFYNGDAAGPYLTRPRQQFAGFEARYQHLVYDLAPRARAALTERGTLVRYLPPRSDPFLHQLMGACVGASFELTAPDQGLRYIAREEILTHPKCPETTKRSANPMAIPIPGLAVRSLIPDDLFGLQYPAGFRFFALEIDRHTESIERRTIRQSAFANKIVGYLAILREQRYRSWWGLPNLSILTVTTNEAHARNILKHISRQNEPRLADRFGLRFEPFFGSVWRVPITLLSGVLSCKWLTTTTPRDLTAGSPTD